MAYDREKAIAYAHQWAYKRNPHYMNFTGLGGDCTKILSSKSYCLGQTFSVEALDRKEIKVMLPQEKASPDFYKIIQ